MARGELLRKLFSSYRRGSDDDFRSTAFQIISEEEKKSNHHLAKDLMRILENGSLNLGTSLGVTPRLASPPSDRERHVDLVELRQPQRYLNDILLEPNARATITRILTEYRKSEVLRLHGLRPSSKLLFCGPPGCGKTLCSEIIATELGLSLLYTRFDAIVSSYLGETAANLRKVFEYAKGGRWIVLFDEFDAIGKARDDETEHGELKRVVNSFLQLLDGFDSPSILIAATNHEQMLDPALWRRFDEVVVFPKPTVEEIRVLISIKLRNFPTQNVNLASAALKLKGLSHADVERACFDAIKTAVLEDRDAVDQEILNRAVDEQKKRVRVAEGITKRGAQKSV